MTTDTELNEIFERVSKHFNYRTATAAFEPYRDLKIRWARTFEHADFHVSDYLRRAPTEVVEDIAETIFSKIMGEDRGYTDGTIGWLTSSDFYEKAQPEYLKRDKRIRREEGEAKDLWESVRRLQGMGLVDKVPEGLRILWSCPGEDREAARSSLLMRVIVINEILDSEEVPDAALDLCLLKQLIHVTSDFGKVPMIDTEEMDRRILAFPNSEEILEWFKDHGIEF
ncbi:MAG: hypothetical protein E7Z62_05510 [Thermoplasmata archaeon]|nr:hypothetical protein [Thermoplasmata archaeon]